ncbi:hypothetical protein PCAR4_720086 [Paraburkholderia caribensis]|nr:hypothetical protein PCAR4_720086 [Paraburkholderia caribensis]
MKPPPMPELSEAMLEEGEAGV